MTSHQLAKLLLEQPDMLVLAYYQDDYHEARGFEVHDVALDENGHFYDTDYGCQSQYNPTLVRGKAVSLR